MYLERSGTDMIFGSSYSTITSTLTNALNTITTTSEVFIAMSVQYMARNTDYMLCIYISQTSSGYTYSDCIDSITIGTSVLSDGGSLTIDLGPGLSGHVKSLHISHVHEHPVTMAWFILSYDSYRPH